jgi:hypothetical protein
MPGLTHVVDQAHSPTRIAPCFCQYFFYFFAVFVN